MHRSTALAAAACLLLAAACSGSEDADPGATAAASTAETATAADTCTELTDAGYTGADFGPVATFETPDAVSERLDHLSAIVEVPAPEGLSAEWSVRVGYVERLRTMLDDSGDAALDPAAAMPTEQEDAAAEALTDWWFATCQ